MTDYIDMYCERLGPEFWAEPLNAITNLSFFIAAFLAFVLARRESALNWRSGFLIFMMVVIGSGSFAFHTLATFWAKVSDILPILFYQTGFLIFYSRYVMQLSWSKVGGLFALFTLMMVVFYRLPAEWLNGSLGYAPALLFVLGFGLWHFTAAKAGKVQEPFVLLAATLVFSVSLTFRSVDMQFCQAMPMGTHFMWHVLNGLVLYLCTRALILNQKDRRIFT